MKCIRTSKLDVLRGEVTHQEILNRCSPAQRVEGASYLLLPTNKGVSITLSRLEDVVGKIGEAVLATTETIDQLCERVDTVTHQVQQQGYQIFALSDAIQTLAENQDQALKHLAQLQETLGHLAQVIENQTHHNSDQE